MMTYLGYKPPFDRHDWVVDRCGTEIRYIIDFYSGKPVEGKSSSVYVDVRPELTMQGAIDRTKMFFKENLE